MKVRTLLSVIAVLSFLALTGCAGQNGNSSQKDQNGSQSKTEQAAASESGFNFYGNDLFSIKLPAKVIQSRGNVIAAADPKSFPAITFAITAKSEMENFPADIDALIGYERQLLRALCTETDSCGTIMNLQKIDLGTKKAVKYTKYIQGRNLGETEGYINEFRYIALDKNYMYEFETDANDLEKPDQVRNRFDEIMKTIEFKK